MVEGAGERTIVLEAFYSIEGILDPLVQKELLHREREDGNIPLLAHALSVTATARGAAADYAIQSSVFSGAILRKPASLVTSVTSRFRA